MFLEDKYSKYVKKGLIKAIDQQMDFLKNTSLFFGVDEPAIHKYSSYFFPKNYRYKEIVYHQYEESDYIYLIADG